MKEHLQMVMQSKFSSKTNSYGYNSGDCPFIDYIVEDKTDFKPLGDFICPMTGKHWVDKDNDFLMGLNEGVLMKMDFVFVNTAIFSRVADFYEKHGTYCLAPEDSPAYKKFWQREMDRRTKGVQARCKLYIKDIPAYLNCKTEEVTEIPLSFSISIQSEVAALEFFLPLTTPAWAIAPP